MEMLSLSVQTLEAAMTSAQAVIGQLAIITEAAQSNAATPSYCPGSPCY